jgi:hypothetical protein
MRRRFRGRPRRGGWAALPARPAAIRRNPQAGLSLRYSLAGAPDRGGSLGRSLPPTPLSGVGVVFEARRQ